MRVMSKPIPITQARVLMLAAVAEADPRTARSFLEGHAVKGEALRERLKAALEKLDAGAVKVVNVVRPGAKAKKGGA